MVAMVAFQAGAARVPTFTGLVLLRGLTAFMGSPVLSTGGATLGDMVRSYPRPKARGAYPLPPVVQFKPIQLPVIFSIWIIPAFSAPAVGPVFGNFAAQANGWRWTMYELLWIVGFVTIFLIFAIPETVSTRSRSPSLILTVSYHSRRPTSSFVAPSAFVRSPATRPCARRPRLTKATRSSVPSSRRRSFDLS